MLVEIRKAGFVNKGAELMLYAVLQKMKEAYPAANFAMVPTDDFGAAPFLKRAELGLLQKVWFWRFGLQLGDLAVLAPQRIRRMYGLVLDKEISVVLDAAGFSYSDQWGVKGCQELASSCKRWKKKGIKSILLPQAFGPFTTTKIKDAIKSVADNADLIFARERESYEHLVEVVGVRSNIKIANDFTNLVEGVLPIDFDVKNHRFCIVPNYRMIDKTNKKEREAYLPFLVKCVQYLQDQGVRPFVLVHEGNNDLILAEKIRHETGGSLPIVKENNPLRIKGILGACEGTIGSRFHGLVSALSQGVPSLALGWSHKYRRLFEDYGFEEGFVNVTADDVLIRKKIDMIIRPESKKSIRQTLSEKSEVMKYLSEKMWQSVIDVINTMD